MTEHILAPRVRFCAGQPPNVKYNSTYSVDGRRSSWEGYDSKLRGYGILVKAKNSLVFQVCKCSASACSQPGPHLTLQSQLAACAQLHSGCTHACKSLVAEAQSPQLASASVWLAPA